MRKSQVIERKKGTKKSQVSTESKDKKSTLIKTTSEIEKELEIPSYDEFRIKDNDSLMDYDDEDIESKMIRLVFLKQKGENIKDKINLRKKIIPKKNEYLLKKQRVKIAISILEKLEFRKRAKLFFKYINKKKISLMLKVAANLFYKIKKYIFITYIRNVYYFIFPKDKKEQTTKFLSINRTDMKNLVLLSPQYSSNKKFKKFKFPAKVQKLELITKKNNMNKKSGVETILERIGKEKEKERILCEKLKRLDNMKKREKEYIFKMNQKRKKLKQEIELYKRNHNISDDAISQIKQNNNISDRRSDFFSNDNSSKFGSFHLDNFDSTIKTEEIFRIPKNIQKNSKNLNSLIITNKKKDRIENELELYSINSKKLNASERENPKVDKTFMRNSVINFRSTKKLNNTNNDNLKIRAQLSGSNFRNTLNQAKISQNPKTIEKKIPQSNKKLYENILLNDSENLLKEENKGNLEEQNEKSTIMNQNEGEESEYLEEDEEEGGEISDSNDDDFIQIPENRYDYKESPTIINKNAINLVEYDTFYKEQFFKDDLFKYDGDNLKDKETEKIKKEMNKLDIKQKIKEKTKLKEVNELKGLNTDQLKNEIEALNEKYKELKKKVQEKIVLKLDTREEFVNKGRLLNCYFKNITEKNFPKFSIESEEELGAKEIIDFKPLRKEELSRRYFDYCFCFEQRKKIHDCRIAMRYSCRYYVDNWWFENLSTLITIFNCIFILLSDPTNPNDIWNLLDNYFLIFYLTEVALKINTFSFYSAEDAYIRDYWNVLDLFVAIIGVISFILERSIGNEKANISGLNGLKAFRILKPLKTMKRFKSLRNLVLALIASISRLWEILIVLFFFFLFFAVAGLQMWQGLFLRRCLNLNYGYLITDNRNTYLCSFDSDCASLNSYGNKFICAKGYINPNSGSTSFDNIFYSLITVFIMVTLEGWTNIFTYVSKTFKDKIYLNRFIIFIYFHAFVYIGAFYLINLFLAVTNSEFEHIEKSRKELNTKKSFYQLIKSYYDPKEKRNKDKRETQKKLRIKNDKKSNEALKNLYYKIKEEAFHIHKNRRGVPKVYSTVKDIYIMANNNPEELYLEKQRIRDEEKSLCEDVKRRQKEIDILLKKNKIESEKIKVSSKKINIIKKNNTTTAKEKNKNENKNLNYKYTIKNNSNVNNNKDNDSHLEQKSIQNVSKILNQANISADLDNIIKLINNIDPPLVEISKDKIDKYYNDKRTSKIKIFEKFKEEQNKKNKICIKEENQNKNEITYYEDTNFEKKLEELSRIKTVKKLGNLQKRKPGNAKINHFLSKSRRSSRKFDMFVRNRNSIQNYLNSSKQLDTQISCIKDLMLSSLSGTSESSDLLNNKRTIVRRFTHVHHKKNMKLTKLVIDDFNKNLDNLSFENDLFNNSLFNNTRRKSLNLVDSNTLENFTTVTDQEENESQRIIKTKEFPLYDNFVIKSKIERPHSTLNNILKYENDQKYNNQEIRFDLKKYLKQEAEKDIEFLNKDRRKSFLGFLEYAQYQKQQEELEELINNENQDKDSSYSENSNNSGFADNSLHFLNEDSFLSRNNNISVDDLDLLPGNIFDKKVYKNEYLLHENLKKNLDSNKLTQKIRAEVFYRESVNTNINLTTNELKKYYEEVNKKLDEQLYVNSKKIRIRDNVTNCNVSGIIKYTNYNKNLKTIKRDEENDDNDEEEEKNKNNNLNINDERRASEANNKITINMLRSHELSSIPPDKNIALKSPRINEDMDKSMRISPNKTKGLSTKKILGIKDEEKNSKLPLLRNQKTLNILNLKTKNENFFNRRESDKKISSKNNKFSSKLTLNNRLKNNSVKSGHTESQNRNKGKIKFDSTFKSIGSKNKDHFFSFKAKSIDKNNKKYPKEDSKKFIVYEENKESKDILTIEQELIPTNLRGKKYYMNYLFNIMDIDLKVKDNFKVNRWKDEVYGIKPRFFSVQKLPYRTDAFFVFNDKILNLLKYKYIYYTDYRFKKKELSYLTMKLKYLPLNVIVLMPKRLRNFGKFANKQNLNMFNLNEFSSYNPYNRSIVRSQTSALNFYPNSALVSTIGYNNNQAEESRSVRSVRSVSRMTYSRKNTSKGDLNMSSAYSKNYMVQKQISFKKDYLEKMYKKMNDFNYLTLSHYFLNEENLKYKIMDSKRKEDIINANKEKNRKKYNRMKIKNEIENILLYDRKTKSHTYIKWSGEDVLYHKNVEDNRKNWNRLINSLEDFNLIIWNKNPYVQRVQKIRYAFYIFANNDYFEYTILSIVIINSLFLGMEGNMLKPEYSISLGYLNVIFNIIFIFEYIVKFVGFSPIVYYSDAFAYLDTLIIVFSILDMVTPEDDSDVLGAKRSISSQLSFLRVFRIFRVIRIAKVLRKLKSMRFIIVSIKKSMKNVIYIIVILILFTFIFVLLGMSLLFENSHYKTGLIAFYTTYQILTLENWDTIFYDIYALNKFCIFYFVFWIFIGNYILFNLFLSIMIQSFNEMDMEDEDDLTEQEIIERIYPLPDYLYSLKNNITDYNYIKINEQRKINKDPMNNTLFSSGTMTNNSKDGMSTKFTSSNMVNTSKLTIDTDEEEDSEKDDFSRSVNNVNDELEEIDTNDKNFTKIERRMIRWQKINRIFKKNDCEDSLFLFSQSNNFRILCMKLINHAIFDKFILFIIILSTTRLILDTFLGGYKMALFFDVCDTVFNLIFIFEALIKIIALGFAFDEGSYLRDNWNQMDAIIVLCSFVEFYNTFQKYFNKDYNFGSIEFLKIIRLLRTLRPLRFISHNDNLKLIITSLFDSVLPICNTLFILIVVLFIFSIVGISLFYSYFHNCYVFRNDGIFELSQGTFDAEFLEANNITNQMTSISDFCDRTYNGIMDTGPTFKFSNIVTAFITSYVLSTMEGWPDIMNSYRIYGNQYGIFFVIFNLVVSYFFLNLFTGIMFKYFNEAYKRQQKLDSNDKKAAKYYDYLTQIMSAQSDYIIWKKPSKGSIKYYLREIVDSEHFENLMLGIIFYNFLLLCLTYENCSENYSYFIKINNRIITVLFTIEFFLKLCAYGFKSYFYVSWNKFDFATVIISYVDWQFDDVKGVDSSFLRTFQLVRILRVLRVSRILRLIKALKGLEKLIQTLQWSISALSHVLFLTIVLYGTIALMGCYLYEGDKTEVKIKTSYFTNDYFNFNNFYTSYLLIFRCSTGENWHNIMMEYAYGNKGVGEDAYSFAFFILDNFLTSVILLNLLLMVTLQQYDEFTDKKYNPIDKFNSFIKDFNSSWNKFSSEENEGCRIKKTLTSQFLIDLNLQKFLLPEKNKLEYAKKYVSDLKLYYDKEDYVYYHDVIFKILYKLYGTKINRENPENNLIFKAEKKILKQIRTNINKFVQKKKGNIIFDKNQKYALITFNPLTSHLYYKFSYNYMKMFINYYKENEQLLQHLKENISNKIESGESNSFSVYSDESESKSNNDEENENEEEEDNEEEEEESDENEEGESLNGKESGTKSNQSSLNMPDNNIQRKKSENKSENKDKTKINE